MFKQTILVAAALALFAYPVAANRHCNKNAWVVFNTSRNGKGQACGQMTITSGKSAYDLPTATAMRAISDCAYSHYGCTGNWVDNSHWEFCCTESPDWKAYYSGSMNIEFDCSDGPYTCYDLKWN
ncbi:hypothetical protein BGZ75_003114 [Mortierella antarctica]|nr:hypothetical protein BGZ75_003114 [Mortierella antarctica]